jgi:excisionase family DNA binding protein
MWGYWTGVKARVCMEEPVTRRTYTIDEAARLLGIGRNSAYESAKRGEIPAIKIGKRVVVPKAALDRMLAGERT